MRGCYLLHASRPIGNPANKRGQAQHYIGWATDIAARLRKHKAGNGAKLVAAFNAAGVEWKCVRRWKDATRDDERKLHNRHNAARLCPVCRATKETKETNI